MPLDQRIVTIINVVLAAAASGVNLAAAAQFGGRLRTVYAFIGSLAAIYTVSYLVLLSGRVAPADWSAVMRGVSIVVWPVVWTAPAFYTIRARRDLIRVVEDTKRVIHEEITQRHPDGGP